MQAIDGIAYVATLITTYTVTPLIASYMKRRGHEGIDAHKPTKPRVPTSCGLGIIVGMLVGACLLSVLEPSLRLKIMVFISSVLIAAAVGLVDDFVVLGGTIKTALTVLAIAPIVLSAYAYPEVIVLGRPEIPIVGRLRLTIVYWLLLPLAVAGPANAVNMLDVLNGVMPITCAMASGALLVSSLLLAREDGVLLSALLLVALLAYIPYNKYPAKVFSGDVGSLGVGAALGAIAVLSRTEIIAMAALSPHIMNAFYVIAFVKGLKEHRQIPRPVRVKEDGTIVDSENPKAPITLVRILVGKEGAKEPEVVKAIILLEAIAVLIALTMALMMKVM